MPLPLHAEILGDLREITESSASWEKLRDRTVLITGAGGMIASYLVYTLLYLNDTKKLNIKVLGLVRNGKKAEQHFSGLTQRVDFELLVQDVCDPVEYDGAVDYIIHAASQASPRSFVSDPVGTIKANTVGTISLLNLAVKKQSAGFLYLSTREIYGRQAEEKEFIAEDDYGIVDPTLVRSCYPESKRMSETLCVSYHSQYGVPCKIARIAHTYGPGIAISDGRVVGDFIGNVIRNENITLNSDGSTVLGLTYIRDLIAGLFLLLLDMDGMVYNISNQDAVITVKELAQTLSGMYPQRKIQVAFTAVSEAVKAGYLAHKVALLHSSKANAAGWLPAVGIEEGFRRTIQYAEDQSRGGMSCPPSV